MLVSCWLVLEFLLVKGGVDRELTDLVGVLCLLKKELMCIFVR